MSNLLKKLPDTVPEKVKGNPVINNFLKASIRQMLEEPNNDVMILAKIGEAFLQQHTINGAKTAEKYSDEDVANVQRHTYDLIVAKYSNLSMHEVIHAFKAGMSGQYGELVYFSARAVNHWLSEYIDRERKPAMRDYHKLMQSQPQNIKKEPNPEEREEIRRQIFNDFAKWIDKQVSECSELINLGQFKPESISMPMHAPYWYEKLIKMNVMPEPSVEDRNIMYEKALSMTRPSDQQKDFSIIKAKGWFVRLHIYNWIINDVNYKELLTSFDKLD